MNYRNSLTIWKENKTAGNSGLAKVAIHRYGCQFIYNSCAALRKKLRGKIATFASPPTVSTNFKNQLMKQLLTFILLILTTHLTYSQACGTYRIKYIGRVESAEKRIVSIYLPTSMYLHSVEKENSKLSFVETLLTNGAFEMEISSHLTTPFNDAQQLLTYYRNQSKNFKIKIEYSENNVFKETLLEIDWDDLKVSIVSDEKFGTLFEFNLGDIKF